MTHSRPIKKIRFRCWAEVDGVKFFGPGRADLLERIEKFGSIAKAAKAMRMSYKKAWVMVEEMNALARKPLVVPQKGGQYGGGTKLTKTGNEVVSAFKKLNKKLAAIVKKETTLLKIL